MIKIAGLVAAFVVAIGLAFYGGRAYQNNIDQPLFTAYNPPKTTTGGGFRSSSFFGSAATGGGGQVAAALALATPPTSGGQLGGTGSASTISSKKARGTASSAAGKTNKASGASGAAGAGTGGSGSVPGSGGTPAAGATATDIAGTLQSIDSQSVKVKTAQGAVQSVVLGASTTYYLAKSASASALKVGQKVTLGLQPNSSGGLGAGSITIAPPGTLYGYVRPVAAGTASGAGGAGAGGGAGSGGGFGFSLAATITAVSDNSITAANATGRSFTLPLKTSTPIYQLIPVARMKLITGATVSVHALPASGKLVAENVVASNLHGMVVSLTAQQARRRAGGFGGADGSGGGFGGGAAGGSSGG